MLFFKTAISALTLMKEFTSANKINDAKEHSTQLKQKDDRKLEREQRRSTGLLKKPLKNGLVDADAKDRGGVKLEPDVGILRGKDRQLKKEENVCDPYFGTDGFGLCVSFCVTRNCDEVDQPGCDQVKARFEKATGKKRLPCEECDALNCDDGSGGDACDGAMGEIGCGSCIGLAACFDAEGNVGEYSCVGEAACLFAEGTRNVGEYSCLGWKACYNVVAEGDIGNNSCVGERACGSTEGNIGSGSCIGEKSCCGNTTDIGDDSCNDPFECCVENYCYNGCTPS